MDQTTLSIPHELFAPAESSFFQGTYRLESLQAGPDVYTFAEPLSWQVNVSNTGGALLVTGTVCGVGRTSCVRCLEDVDVDIDGQIEGYFLLNAEDEPDPEEELEEDEFDVIGPENTIDLVPLIVSAVLVDIPLLPLCDDDCKGLCPHCGVNLNEETCNCESAAQQEQAEFEEARNPFAALKNLHFDEDEA